MQISGIAFCMNCEKYDRNEKKRKKNSATTELWRSSIFDKTKCSAILAASKYKLMCSCATELCWEHWSDKSRCEKLRFFSYLSRGHFNFRQTAYFISGSAVDSFSVESDAQLIRKYIGFSLEWCDGLHRAYHRWFKFWSHHFVKTEFRTKSGELCDNFIKEAFDACAFGKIYVWNWVRVNSICRKNKYERFSSIQFNINTKLSIMWSSVSHRTYISFVVSVARTFCLLQVMRCVHIKCLCLHFPVVLLCGKSRGECGRQ